MSSLLRALLRPQAATPLAAFRMAAGVCVVITLLGPILGGAADAIWLAPEYGGYRPGGSVPWIVELLGGKTPAVVHGLIAAGLLFGALTAAGLGGRLTIFLALQSFSGVINCNAHSGGSFDELLTNGLWILVLAPSTATWSLDAVLTTGRWTTDRTVPAFWLWIPRFILLLLVYWTTGLQKLSHHWVPGGDLAALYYILQQPSWHRGDMSWLAHVFPLTQVMTLTTWLWEVSMPVWFVALLARDGWGRVGWMKRWRVAEA